MNRKHMVTAWLISALAVIAGSVWVATGAGATEPTPLECKAPVTTHLTNRPDFGHGTPQRWATLTLDRTVTLCLDFTSTETGMSSYHAIIEDTGTLVTIAGDANSPNAGAAIAAAVTGTVTGTAIQPFVMAGAPWTDYGPSKLASSYDGGAPEVPGTGDMAQLAYGSTPFTKNDGITAYSWTYVTCAGEKWIDSDVNDDGQADAAGDITGKLCPIVTPSTTPAASPPAVTPKPKPSKSRSHTSAPAGGVIVTSSSNGAGVLPVDQPITSLPVTGDRSPLPYLIAAGGALVALGLLVIGLLLRRARRELDRLANDYAERDGELDDTTTMPAYERGTSPVHHRW